MNIEQCKLYLMPGMRCVKIAGHEGDCVNDEPNRPEVVLDNKVPFPKEFFKLPHDEYHYEESTGMEYFFYRRECDHVVGVCHIDVGETDYYYADESTWDAIVDGYAALSEDGWRVTNTERNEDHPGFGRVTVTDDNLEIVVEKDPGNDGAFIFNLDTEIYYSDVAAIQSITDQALA